MADETLDNYEPLNSNPVELEDEINTSKEQANATEKQESALENANEISNCGVPSRTLLCRHYASETQNSFDSAVETNETRIFNRTKKILAALEHRPYEEPKLYSSSTQTAAFHTEYEETERETYTQPYNPILYGSAHVPGEYTMYANASRYETAEQFFIRRETAVKLIQSCWRRYKSQLYCEALRQAASEKKQFILKQQEENDVAQQKERQYELERRIQPRTAEDFKLLYEEVDAWVRQRKFSINQANLTPEARQAALELLVQKESRLLQNIESLKKQTQLIAKQDKTANFFKKISEPRRWQLYDGSFAAVHTPYTLRAQSLRNCYYALEQENISLDQRLDVLLQCKFILKEFDCELTRNAIRMIDEEADLLSRNRSSGSMRMLRQRIQQSFLDFCENPEFNPGVLTLIKDFEELKYRPNTLPIIEKAKLTAPEKEQLNRLKQEEIKKAVYSELDQTKEKISMIEMLGEVCQQNSGETKLDAECEADEVGIELDLLENDEFMRDGIVWEQQPENNESVQMEDEIPGEDLDVNELK